MGRKKKGGGGMKGFLKTAKKAQDDSDSSESEKDEQDASAVEVPKAKEAALDLQEETKAQLRERHQKEMKAAKQEATKLGKKKKQEAAELIESVKDRHESELQQLKSRLQSTSEDEAAVDDPIADADDGDSLTVAKKSKAQKRREKEAQKLEERETRIREGMEALGVTERESEEQTLKQSLAEMGYEIYEIRPDGHCLYRSIEDQLSLLGHEPKLSAEELRKITANELRSNAEGYLPFFAAEGDKAESEFLEHCDKVEKSAEWGGELEVEALSKALRKMVVIYSAELGERTVGGNFGGIPARVCFMEHAFQLGAHYNSVRLKQL